jgi:hypothetical protein
MARSASSQITLGIALLAIGGTMLATRFIGLERAPAWMLGLGFALALIAVVRRHYGALVGGMVLLGLGAGMVLGDREVAGWRLNTWLLVALAAAFLGVYAIGALLKLRNHPWPLIVAGVLIAVVAARFAREFTLLPPAVVIAVRTWWPAILVVVGVLLLFRGSRR